MPIKYSVPTKVLVPALEYASLEDPNSILVEWWAQLLTTSVTDHPVRPYLVDIMRSIGSYESIFLERFNELDKKRFRKFFPSHGMHPIEAFFPWEAWQSLVNTAAEKATQHSSDEESGIYYFDEILETEAFDHGLILRGYQIRFNTKSESGDMQRTCLPDIYDTSGDKEQQYAQSLNQTVDVCVSLNLIREVPLSATQLLLENNLEINAIELQLTTLGIEFLNCCHPNGR